MTSPYIVSDLIPRAWDGNYIALLRSAHILLVRVVFKSTGTLMGIHLNFPNPIVNILNTVITSVGDVIQIN